MLLYSMVGKTHQLIGFASVYSLALWSNIGQLNTQTLIASVVLISIGSLTPDLDNEDNKLYTLLPIGHGFFSNVGEKLFGRHRSISHSFVGIVLFGYISYFLIYKIPPANGFRLDLLWYSFFISLISHIGADALTREGIPLLWPIKWKIGFPPFKFLRMKTGGFVEKYFVRTFVLIYLVVVTYLFWPEVKLILGI